MSPFLALPGRLLAKISNSWGGKKPVWHESACHPLREPPSSITRLSAFQNFAFHVETDDVSAEMLAGLDNLGIVILVKFSLRILISGNQIFLTGVKSWEP
jgi:hypothetical protein